MKKGMAGGLFLIVWAFAFVVASIAGGIVAIHFERGPAATAGVGALFMSWFWAVAMFTQKASSKLGRPEA